jgi:hypothetical protein
VLLLLAGTHPRRAQVWLTALVGLLPLFAAAVYYPVVLGMGPLDSLRFAVLLQAGGFTGPLATVGGCLIVAAVFVALLQLHWTAPTAADKRRRNHGFGTEKTVVSQHLEYPIGRS